MSTGSRSTIARTSAAIGVALLLTVSAAPAGVAGAGGKPYRIALTGAAEVPGPGDSDGSGRAEITVNPGRRTVCWTLEVSDIAPTLAAHIHRAPAGVAGQIVVHLSAPNPTSSGCMDVDRELAIELVRNPADFYVNVHTPDHPAGALRGQLG